MAGPKNAGGGKKKGTSKAQKYSMMLNYMLKMSEPFKKEEVWGFAKKEGITNSRDVADEVLKALVGDGLVCQEKIGIGSFFWSFQGDYQKNIKNQLEIAEKRVEKLKLDIQKSKLDYEKAMIGREESDERTQKLEQLKQLKQQIVPNSKRIQELKINSPENLAQIREQTQMYKRKSNFWLDQIYQVERFMKYDLKKQQKEISDMFKGYMEDPQFDYTLLEEYNLTLPIE